MGIIIIIIVLVIIIGLVVGGYFLFLKPKPIINLPPLMKQALQDLKDGKEIGAKEKEFIAGYFMQSIIENKETDTNIILNLFADIKKNSLDKFIEYGVFILKFNKLKESINLKKYIGDDVYSVVIAKLNTL